MTAEAVVEHVNLMANCLPSTTVRWSSRRQDGYRLLARDEILSAAVTYCSPYFTTCRPHEPSCRADSQHLVAGLAPAALAAWGIRDLGEAVPMTEHRRLRWTDHRVGEWRVICRFRDDALLDIFTFGPSLDATLIVDTAIPVHLGLVRLLRNRFTSDRLGAGHRLLHGAAMNIDEHGLLLLGEKEAGKTTMVCELLNRDIASFVSNDRAILSPDSTISGLPVSVAIRASTIDRYSALNRRSRSLLSHRLGLDETGTQTYTVRDLVECFSATITPTVSLETIVHLVRSQGSGVRLSQLSANDAYQQITSSILPIPDSTQPFWGSGQGNLDLQILDIYRLDIGTDETYEAVSLIRDLIIDSAN